MFSPRAAAMLVSLVLFAQAPSASAEPWFGFHDNALEDQYEDGDLDEEDVNVAHPHRVGGTHHAARSDLRARSFVSLVGFYKEAINGRAEFGAIAVLGLPFDKVAAGRGASAREAAPTHVAPVLAEPPPSAGAAPPQAPESRVEARPARLALTAAVARKCVAAAWRASGLGVDDARLEAIVSRARLSAILPETRLRVMRLVNATSRTDTVPLTDTQRLYDASAANLWLEARLTWRLDRLLFADEEPTLERVRIERQDARARVAEHVLKLLFHWQRATLEARSSNDGSQEKVEALLRALETEATLDVLTNGWFSSWRESERAKVAGQGADPASGQTPTQ